MRVLFTTTARPLVTEETPGAFWRGLRLLAVDGICWDVADTAANESASAARATAAGRTVGVHVNRAQLMMRRPRVLVSPQWTVDSVRGPGTSHATLMTTLPEV
ncbi:hypothetical protein GCM10010365_74040 [Streptomyces poonensis]|uniref:Uncharacterized protein n=1 Tax=Streptomyces poonensis TaxID=68255 RepID=A0A918UYA8_9ACTN|nr:hypothetical protein GCM10010365_74040 [Streptomyces poonensis]